MSAAAETGDAEHVARRSRWLLGGAVLALLAVHLPLLGPSLVGRQVFAETRLFLLFAPWSADAARSDQRGVTQSQDTIDSAIPALAVFRERLLAGDFPLWMPWTAGGAPLASVPEHALLSPLSLPYLVLPLSMAPAWVRLLEVVVAVGATALFLRRIRLSPGPALLGGLIYSCTAFFVLWNNWPQAQVAALVPALFWTAERALQERRARAAVPVALVVAAMLLASFPAVLVYSLYLLGPYVVIRTLARRAPVADLVRSFALLAGGLTLGVALAAFQVLPFVHHLRDLDLGHRAQGPGDHAPFSALVTMVVPYAFGTETAGTYFGFRNPIETIAYVGGVCLLLAVVAVSQRVRLPLPRGAVVLFAGAVVTLVLVAWSSDTALAAAQRLPLLDSSFIGRTRSGLGFAMAVLAAIGAERLVRRPWRRRATSSRSLAAVLPAVVVCAAAAWAVRGALGVAAEQDRTPLLLEASVLPLLVLLAALVAVACALRGGRTGAVALGVLPVLVAVEGLAFVAPRWPSEDPAQFYPRTGVHDFLAANLDGQRYAAPDRVLFPSTNAYYGLRAVSGHGFHQPSWMEAVERVDPTVSSGPTFSLLGSTARTAASPLLDRLSAHWFVAPLHDPVLGRLTAPPAPVGSTSLGPGRTLVLDLAPGPRRALVLRTTAAVAGQDTGRLLATFTDGEGTTLGSVVRLGLRAGQPAGLLHVPVPGEDGPLTRARHVSLEVQDVVLSLGTAQDGLPSVGEVRPDPEDGLELALVGEAVVYERTRALPRVRFASSAVRVTTGRAALRLLARGRLSDDEVLLTDPGRQGTDHPDRAAEAADRSGDVEVVEDSGDVLRLRSSSDHAGWVVVADALQQAGWRAELDGRPAELLHADHVGVAVSVPAGRHDVVLRYVPPGLRTGAAVSAVAALLVLGLLVGHRRPQPGVDPS